jgi:hypothetical protein
MAKSKGKGTSYSPRETEQRSYFLPPGLGDAFKEFNNGNASTGARGAFVLFMACRKFPELREQAISAAEHMGVRDAVDLIEKKLTEEITTQAIHEWARSLPEAEKAKLLAQRKVKP